MTKRSSFVIPPDLADVAAIVDMLDRSPQLLMQSLPPCADLRRTAAWSFNLQGNIAVKALPIRLLALCTVVREGSLRFGLSITRRRRSCCVAQRGAELTAITRGGIGRLQPTARQ